MPSTAFVQLARTGDIVSALPIMRDKAHQGRDVYCYVHPEFASIFEAVSYVKPIIRDSHHRDVPDTIKRAKLDGHDEVIATQVDSNPEPAPTGWVNFIQQQWARAGYLDRFHDLPLIFDKRDAVAEAKIIKAHLPAQRVKPILAYSLTGHSSPFKQWKELAAWVRGAFGYQFDLLDLTELRLEKPQYLLPLIEAADVCLFSDSMPLHLTYAFCKPVFVLHRDSPAGPGHPVQYWWSERRKHWLGQMVYNQTLGAAGRQTIAQTITNRASWPDIEPPMNDAERSRKIVHVVNWFESRKPDEARRNANARASWETVNKLDPAWSTVFFDCTKDARRTSEQLGDSRSLPYLKDVIDFAAASADPDDVVCLTNADSRLVTDAGPVIRRAMRQCDCLYSRRIQVSGEPPIGRHRELAMLPVDAGVDLIAFRVGWWRENAATFPDFLIGCDTWDCAYSRIIARSGGKELTPPVVIHEMHGSFWKRPENIETNPGQRHNRWLYRSWAVLNGLSPVI